MRRKKLARKRVVAAISTFLMISLAALLFIDYTDYSGILFVYPDKLFSEKIDLVRHSKTETKPSIFWPSDGITGYDLFRSDYFPENKYYDTVKIDAFFNNETTKKSASIEDAIDHLLEQEFEESMLQDLGRKEFKFADSAHYIDPNYNLYREMFKLQVYGKEDMGELIIIENTFWIVSDMKQNYLAFPGREYTVHNYYGNETNYRYSLDLDKAHLTLIYDRNPKSADVGQAHLTDRNLVCYLTGTFGKEYANLWDSLVCGKYRIMLEWGEQLKYDSFNINTIRILSECSIGSLWQQLTCRYFSYSKYNSQGDLLPSAKKEFGIE